MSISNRKITAFSKKITDRPNRERNQGTNIKLYIETPSNELKSALNGVIDDIVNDYASVDESKLDKTGNFTGTWGGESKSSIDSKIATATTNGQNALTQVIELANTVNQFEDRIETAETNSQTAVMKTTVLEGQFNQLIINAGNSNAEIVASRVKEDGTEFDSLPERLNAADSAFESHLSDNMAHGINNKVDIATYNKHTSGWINVKEFGAVGDGVTDDTIAFQNAIDTSITNKLRCEIPSGTYLITDTLKIGDNVTAGQLPERLEITGAHMMHTILKFKTTTAKPLFYLGPNSGYVILQKMTLEDADVRKNTAIELQDYYDAASNANWKNNFEFIHIKNFNKGIVFNGDTTQPNHTQDTHLDGTTLRKVGIWDYNVAIEINNIQAVQMYGFDVDLISTFSGNENSIGIVNNCGASWTFEGGSWIGNGTFVKFNCTGTYYQGSKYDLENIKFEFRSPYTKPVIAYSDASEGYASWSGSNVLGFTMQDCGGTCYGQSVTLIKTPVVGKALFKNNYFDSDTTIANLYSTTETIILSGSTRGAKGSICFDGCTPININVLSDTSKYLNGYGRIPEYKVLNTFHSGANPNTTVDTYGYYSSKESSYESSQNEGIVNYTKKITGFRTIDGSNIPTEFKIMLPKSGMPLNLLVPRTSTVLEGTRVEYYVVKDNSLWANPSTFALATDALKLGQYDFSATEYGLVTIPIKATANFYSFTGGYTLKVGSANWKEGRFLIRFVNSGTGALIAAGQTPLEFILIEYI